MCSPILRCDWCLGEGISRRRRRRSCSLFHTPTTAIMHTCVRYRPGSGASKIGHKLSKLRKGKRKWCVCFPLILLHLTGTRQGVPLRLHIIFTFRRDDRNRQFNHICIHTLDYRREYMSRNVGCDDQETYINGLR